MANEMKSWTVVNHETGEEVKVTVEATKEATVAHPSRTTLFDVVCDDVDEAEMGDWGDQVEWVSA